MPLPCRSAECCDVAGPGGLLGAVEGLSYAVIIAGGAVLGLQVPDILPPILLPAFHCTSSKLHRSKLLWQDKVVLMT